MRNSLLEVTPVIPASLSRLPELAGNLFFSWHRPTRALFEDLDPELWKQVGGNPRLMLRCVNQGALERCARDEAVSRRATSRYSQTLDAYLGVAAPTRDAAAGRLLLRRVRLSRELSDLLRRPRAFSPATTARPRAMSGSNFVAVGLLYEQGYFIQSVDNDGVQHAEYHESDPRDLPVEPARDAGGSGCR